MTELKDCCPSGDSQQTPPICVKNRSLTKETGALVQLGIDGNQISPTISNTTSNSSHLQDGMSQIAKERIISRIMIAAWRSRRQDVKALTQKMENFKKWSVKAENQIHMYDTMYTIEHKRNEELENQLKRALEHMDRLRESNDTLTQTIMSLKADKTLLEEELRRKHRDVDVLSDILGQAKTDLADSLEAQRHLRNVNEIEQKNILLLQSQKNKLVDVLSQMSGTTRDIENKYRGELVKREREVEQAHQYVYELQSRMEALKRKDALLQEARVRDGQLRREVVNLQHEVMQLRYTLGHTMYGKLQHIWKNFVSYQRHTLSVAHLFAFYLLPATPPPKSAFFV